VISLYASEQTGLDYSSIVIASVYQPKRYFELSMANCRWRLLTRAANQECPIRAAFANAIYLSFSLDIYL
jgi:hypothetical protein